MTLKHPEKLTGVDPRLAKAVILAAERLPFDVTVSEGLRSAARQAQLWAQGRTVPGPQVTWVQHSNHQDGVAVDIYPLRNGALSNVTADYDLMAKEMFKAAKEIGFPIRWGADWDRDGKPRERGETDNPHFEIDRGAK